MSGRFEPYDTYQDSKLDWLGEVPSHWELRRLGGFFNERREKVSDKDFPPLSVTMQGIVPQLEDAAKTKDGDNRKLVRRGDFVINSRSDRKGSSGVSPLDGSVSLIAIVLEPEGLVPEYVHHLLRSEAFQEEFYRFGKGIVADLWSTNYSAMKNITIPVLSSEEQKQIASFLDYETAKIDALIEKQQQLIALLGEKRQAVISHAVTKGLNPDAPMRDSGVEWLGEVPEHWKLRRLKHAVADDGIQMGPFGTSLINVLREPAAYCVFGQANTISGDFKEVSRWLPESAYRGLQHYRLFPGDLVLTRKGSLGNCRVVPDEVPAGIMDSDTIRVRTRSDLSSVFLAKLMHDALYIEVQIDLNRRGAILPGLNTSVVGNLLLAVPPPQEQFDILADLADKTGRLDQIADNLFDQLSLLRERRTALISAAVTGKIDVRGWKPPSSAAKSETEMEVA